MSRLVLLARIRDVSGALERLLGLLRRRALPLDTLSLYRTRPDTLEVVLRFEKLSTPAERVEGELKALVDLISLRRLTGGLGETAREMALAETEGEIGSWPDSLHGVLRRRADGAVEVTGTPEEIDRALQLMTDRGVLAASARSGEMFPPVRADFEPDPLPGRNTDGPR